MARTSVIAGTATAVSGRVAHGQQQRYAAQQQAPAPAVPAPAPAADPDAAIVAELKQLAALTKQDILTEEEFAAKKAELLGI